MQKILPLLTLAGAIFVCGCDKQTENSTRKIDILTQKIFILEQSQTEQLATIQKQLAMLPAQVDKLESNYYARSQEKALFYHTNTLYLLLKLENQMQAQFQEVAVAQNIANQQAYTYHTNTTDTVFFYTTQMAGALASQEKRIVNDVNTETRRVSASLSGELSNQIKQSAPDKSDSVKLNEIEAALQQIQRDLDSLKTRLNTTNPVPVQP